MYWIFFGISTLFIVGSTSFIFWGILKRDKKQEPENELEIAFLKDQLRQLDKDKKNKITTEDDDLLSIAISRKILTLSRNDVQNKKTNEYSQKMNLFGSLCILFMCSVGTFAIYKITSNNFLYFNMINVTKSNAGNLSTIILSQESIEQIIKEGNERSVQKKSSPNAGKLGNLVEELRNVLTNRPDDLEGHKLLVKNSARLGDFITARKAQKNVLRLLKFNAEASDHANYAELCVLAASGYVSVEARNALEKALLLDANNSQANFYLSLFLLQRNNTVKAIKTWIKLLKAEPTPSRWVKMLIPQIKRYSAELEKKMKQLKNADPELTSLRIAFFEVLEVLEQRVDKYGGSLEIWALLIKSYQNLDFPQKAETTQIKIKTQFGLSDSKFEQLMKKIK